MHYYSKLSRIDKKIDFLELKLFEDSHFIDDLAKKIDKFKFQPTECSKETREGMIFQNLIKQNKGELFLFFHLLDNKTL